MTPAHKDECSSTATSANLAQLDKQPDKQRDKQMAKQPDEQPSAEFLQEGVRTWQAWQQRVRNAATRVEKMLASLKQDEAYRGISGKAWEANLRKMAQELNDSTRYDAATPQAGNATAGAAPAASAGTAPANASNAAAATGSAKSHKTVTHSGFDPESWRHLLGPRYWGAWLVLGILAIFAYIPNRLRDAISWLLAWPISKLNLRFKRVIFDNLSVSFPEHDEAWCQRIYRAFLTHALISMFSLGEGLFLPRSMLLRRWEVFGYQHLEKALKSGYPIIFCIPHALTMDRCGLYLSALGLPMLAMVKKQKNPVFDWFLNTQRLAFGGTIATRSAQGLRTLLMGLKCGLCVYYLCDEDLGDEHTNFAPFMGVPKNLLTTMPRIKKMTKAYVLGIAPRYNLKSANYELHFIDLDDAMTADLEQSSDYISSYYETVIRSAPEQYMWFLRLFKTRPDNRYFTDIYANAHSSSNSNIEIDFAHRITPLNQPLTDTSPSQTGDNQTPNSQAAGHQTAENQTAGIPVDPDYVPHQDYSAVVAAIKAGLVSPDPAAAPAPVVAPAPATSANSDTAVSASAAAPEAGVTPESGAAALPEAAVPEAAQAPTATKSQPSE